MISHRQALFLAGVVLLLGNDPEICLAQPYLQSVTPVQYQGVPTGALVLIRPFEDLQSTFIPFSPPREVMLAPVFEEPPAELAPPLPQTTVTNPPEGAVGALAEAQNDLEASPRLRFRFGGVMQATYDSNIFIQQTNAQADVEFVLAPTLALGGGSFSDPLTQQQQSVLQPQDFENADLIRAPSRPFYYLSYVPSYTAFVDHSNLNSFDNDVSGGAQLVLRRLTLGAFARFQSLRIPDIELGTRDLEQWTSARVYALYKLSDKSQLNAEFYLQNRDYQNFIGSLELWNEDWFDYRYSSKTSFGAGVAAGLVIPSAGPQEYYGRIQARATLNASSKISVAAKAGLELRAVSGAGQAFFPVFGLEGRYAITQRTVAGISIYQQIRSSANLQAMIYVGRGVNVSIQQRILDRWLLAAAVGYTHTEWQDTFMHIVGSINRTDDFVFVNSSLQINLNRWLDSQVGIEFRKNQSSNTGSSFNEVLATWGVHFKF